MYPRLRIKLALLMSVVLLSLPTFAVVKNYWYHDAYGYEQVKTKAVNESKPFVVFIYTDWCVYCKSLNKEYMSHHAVTKSLSSAYLVKLNPEKNDANKKIAEYFETSGYPNFRIVYPNGKSRKLHPFKKNGVKWTPAEFASRIDKALGNT